jgi:heptosyltransferase III
MKFTTWWWAEPRSRSTASGKQKSLPEGTPLREAIWQRPGRVRILVIKLRHHGDVLLSTALHRALVEHFAAEVDVLVYDETRPLLDNNPHVHHLWTIDRKLKGWQRLVAEARLLYGIRRAHYDVLIHLTDQWIGALIARISNANKRIQMFHGKRDSRLWHRSFTDCVTPPPRGTAHAVELNLLCLANLGIDPGTITGRMALIPSAQNVRTIQERLSHEGVRGPYIVVHPAARWQFKCWQDDRFAEVVFNLLQAGRDVVLSAGPDAIERSMTSEIERLAGILLAAAPDDGHRGQLINLGGSLSLPLLAALLSGCRFYIGVDSAPMHMAAALDTPQIALFGPSWVEEWRPWSDKAIVIYAGDFGDLPHPDSINTDDDTRLLQAIPTDAVLQAIAKLEAMTQPTPS